MALRDTMIEMPDHTADVGLEAKACAPEELFDEDGGGIGRKVAR